MSDPDEKSKRRDKIIKDLADKKYRQRIVPNKKKPKLNELKEEDLDDEFGEYLDNR